MPMTDPVEILAARTAPTIVSVETACVSLEASPELSVVGARGSHASSSFTLVRIATDDGVVGYGEVSATPRWSGEDEVTAPHLIRNVLGPAVIGQRLASVPVLTARLDTALAANPFTKAGVNMALWDAMGRRTGLRVTELLGGPYREAVPVKMSLSGDDERLEACLAAIRGRGFRSFKVKVGLEVEADLRRFAQARELVGPDTFLGADANGGWTRLDAMGAIPRLAALGAAFIEQPVGPEDVDGLALLRGRGLPVIADEAVFSLGDVARLIRADGADVASVYVGKSGALERAVRAVAVLDLFGIGALIGSNGEMGLGAAAQVHVACACERLASIPSDIIGHHYYGEDILAEPVRIDGIHAYLPEGPGLGVEPAPEFLGRFS